MLLKERPEAPAEEGLPAPDDGASALVAHPGTSVAPASPTRPAARPPAAPPATDGTTWRVEGDAFALGARLFAEARRWIANGSEGLTPLRDATLMLEAKISLDGRSHEGPLRLWLQLPDRLRSEATLAGATTTKVLAGGNLWVRRPGAAFQHRNREGGSSAREELSQANDDLERSMELARFLTLEGLDGPEVTFEFVGEKQPSGDFGRGDGGTWFKVVRRRKGAPDISFWFAHETDTDGVARATYPGVVRVDGLPLAGIPTEDYLLQGWSDAPPGAALPFRRPTRLQGFRHAPGEAPLVFLQAYVANVEINRGLDAALFEPR